jgi:hypothetical protein
MCKICTVIFPNWATYNALALPFSTISGCNITTINYNITAALKNFTFFGACPLEIKENHAVTAP